MDSLAMIEAAGGGVANLARSKARRVKITTTYRRLLTRRTRHLLSCGSPTLSRKRK
jgi:hypothetical protein